MSSARPGKPLFELLRDEPDAARAARPSGPPPSGAARYVRVPISTAYIAGALMVGLLLLTWALGHNAGFKAGRDHVALAAVPGSLDGLVIRDPVQPPPDQGGATPGPAPRSGPDRTTSQAAAQLPDPDQPAPVAAQATPPAQAAVPNQPYQPGNTGEIITARGFLEADPRQPGANYLVLATLTEGQATEAVQFLASNGLEAIGVPVGGSSTRYRIVSLGLAVPSGQYRATAATRREHERQAAALGARWLKDHQGASDFSQPQWALYQP